MSSVQPSNRKRQASEDSKRAKKTKTVESTEAKDNFAAPAPAITPGLSQHRFE